MSIGNAICLSVPLGCVCKIEVALCSHCIWTWLKIALDHVTTNIMWWQRAFGRNSSVECTLNMGSYKQYNCNEISTFTTDLFHSPFPSGWLQIICEWFFDSFSGCRIVLVLLSNISVTWMRKNRWQSFW